MSSRRASALKRLRGLDQRVVEHVEKITEHPGHIDLLHWKVEIANWLDQMEAVLDHVGKKTAAEWSAKIGNVRRLVQED